MPKSYPQKLAKALRDLYENHYKGKGGWEAISQEKFRGKVSGGTLNRIAYSKKREGSQYLPQDDILRRHLVLDERKLSISELSVSVLRHKLLKREPFVSLH